MAFRVVKNHVNKINKTFYRGRRFFCPAPVKVMLRIPTNPRQSTVNEGLLLLGEADAVRVRRGDLQTHRGDQHVQTSGSRHQPLAPLGVILQDPFIPF